MKDQEKRSRKADEDLKKARESGDKERIRRAEEAERNAERNQERVRRQNAENNRQRAKERRERGLVQQAPRPNVGMYNSYTPPLKKVQSIILEQEKQLNQQLIQILQHNHLPVVMIQNLVVVEE
jgi:hypothetical protein